MDGIHNINKGVAGKEVVAASRTGTFLPPYLPSVCSRFFDQSLEADQKMIGRAGISHVYTCDDGLISCRLPPLSPRARQLGSVYRRDDVFFFQES